MSRIALSLFMFFVIVSVLLSISCGGAGQGGIQPPPPPSGADATGIFFAGFFGGQIVGMSAKTGGLATIPGSSINLGSEMKSFSADPSGTLLVAIMLNAPVAQLVNVQSGGALSPGPAISLTGNSEGSAVLNGRVAIVDSDHNKVNFYAVTGGDVNLISSADTDGEPHSVIFDATGRHLYVANLTGGTISVFSIAPGGELSLQQTVAVMFPIFGPTASPTQIRLNAAGTKLVALAFDSIFVWSVNPSDGTLTSAVSNSYGGTLYLNFQDFTFDPTGNLVYAIESTNNRIYVLLASDSGLTLLSKSPYVPRGPATGIVTNANGDRVYVLEMLAQVETFTAGANGQLTSEGLVPMGDFFLPGQILRVQAR